MAILGIIGIIASLGGRIFLGIDLIKNRLQHRIKKERSKTRKRGTHEVGRGRGLLFFFR